jgi:hypothetical protein
MFLGTFLLNWEKSHEPQSDVLDVFSQPKSSTETESLSVYYMKRLLQCGGFSWGSALFQVHFTFFSRIFLAFCRRYFRSKRYAQLSFNRRRQ